MRATPISIRLSSSAHTRLDLLAYELNLSRSGVIQWLLVGDLPAKIRSRSTVQGKGKSTSDDKIRDAIILARAAAALHREILSAKALPDSALSTELQAVIAAVADLVRGLLSGEARHNDDPQVEAIDLDMPNLLAPSPHAVALARRHDK